jgi:hypothetical protein
MLEVPSTPLQKSTCLASYFVVLPCATTSTALGAS